MDELATPPRARVIGWRVAAALFCRLVLNTARRFAYPFAPVMSRGLGVSLTAMTSLIAINQATGMLGMVFGPLADRYGYQRMMLGAMVMLTLGMLVGGLLGTYAAVLAALLLAGLAKNIFDPAVQAYVGHRVPYGRRGLVIGMLELSWAGSTLVGIPLMGLAIHHWGWQSPFWILWGGALAGLLMVSVWIPTDGHAAAKHASQALWPRLRQVSRHRAALGMVGFGFFISAANDGLFVVYGIWLEQDFGLTVVALGASTITIGVAELGGELLTAAFADRMGLKRSVFWGAIMTGIAYGLLPLVGQTLVSALVALFMLFLAFEFTIVCCLTLCTELLPESRATMMGVFLAMAGLGRFVGALAGGPAWIMGGLTLNVSLCVGNTILALACFAWGLRGWQPTRG